MLLRSAALVVPVTPTGGGRPGTLLRASLEPAAAAAAALASAVATTVPVARGRGRHPQRAKRRPPPGAVGGDEGCQPLAPRQQPHSCLVHRTVTRDSGPVGRGPGHHTEPAKRHVSAQRASVVQDDVPSLIAQRLEGTAGCSGKEKINPLERGAVRASVLRTPLSELLRGKAKELSSFGAFASLDRLRSPFGCTHT